MNCDKCGKEIKDFDGFFTTRITNYVEEGLKTSIAYLFCQNCTEKILNFIYKGKKIGK